MSLWKKTVPTADLLDAQAGDCLVGTLGIKFIDIGDDYIKATMPVEPKTHQPFGLLHGGASVALAETVASTAGFLAAAEGKGVVGQEINANHLRGVRKGLVTATASAFHIGKSTQVWDIQIRDEHDKLVCISRMTAAVIDMP